MSNLDNSFSVSKKVDGVSTTVRGEKAENGWIVTIDKEWTEGEGEKKEWKCETKKYISVEHPLEAIKDKEKKDLKDAEKLLSSILGMGMINV